MITAVLDVNVLVSGFVSQAGIPAAILEAWTDGQFELVLSEHILTGCARAWLKPYFRSRYTEGEIEATLTLLRADAVVVSPVATVRGVAADLEDDLVLATAIAGKAPFLVTGDKRLLDLESYQDIAIVSPRDFLSFLGELPGRR